MDDKDEAFGDETTEAEEAIDDAPLDEITLEDKVVRF